MKATLSLLALLAMASVPAVIAAPVPIGGNQLAERDANAEAEPDYGSYGSYAPPPGGYGTYNDYPEPDGGFPAPKGGYPAPEGGYPAPDSNPGKYTDYPAPEGGYGTYGDYGHYKRAIALIKRLWS
ncbi:MAG: hypothetical protein M1839_000997 [Geoglossum umbratile]|nr:MAG: hypothetical protein M1839_000997 [Geoglossum umbratile]